MKPLNALGSLVTRWLRVPAISFVIFAITSLAAWQYFQTKRYTFSDVHPFQGDSIYNPYADIKQRWLKANFHAHSKSWFGITNGSQDGDRMMEHYQAAGYDIASISDYHRINPAVHYDGNLAIPAYEHGVNLSKQHHLVIGAREVNFSNVMLWQNDHIKQFFLQSLKSNRGLVCINHPGLFNGHLEKDIDALSGYDLIEVLNGHRTYFPHWDSALSVGHLPWILANDDCHDIHKDNFAKSWTLINSDAHENSVLEALQNGRAMAVRRKSDGIHDTTLVQWARKNNGAVLENITVVEGRVNIALNSMAKEIRFIGQNGKVRQVVKEASTASYVFRLNDTYIRTEIEMDDFVVYLNPLVRFDGIAPPSNQLTAKVDFASTFIWRMMILIMYSAVLYVLFPIPFKYIFTGSNIKSRDYEQSHA